jgi:cytoskeleton protein RodZ
MPKSQAPPEERPDTTLGSHFRNARTSQGKSLQEAAQVTCINPTTLANLEADNYTKMPAEVFTRGFIKLYAQYLGLDTNETIKLYVNQEKLDPERPVEQPYRREILTGTAMAHPLSLFKSNPRLRIIAILLTVLLGFYVLGAILKVGQKHPDQATPENELAKSLVDGNIQPPPGAPTATTEGTPQTETPGTAPLTSKIQESPADVAPASDTLNAPERGRAIVNPTQSATAEVVQAGQPVAEKTASPASGTPQEKGTARTGGDATSRQ